MAQQEIIFVPPESAQSAFTKVNENFTELYDYVRSGTYTPTLTNVTNISASDAFVCQWLRVGNIVTVSGKVNIDQTTPGQIELGISLPVASDFVADENCCGTGVGNASGDEPMYIKADATNNRASLNATDTDASNHAHFFHFTYRIL